MKLLAFPYYGGKASLLHNILPQLAVPHRNYCEPFAGSATVAFNKPPAPHTNFCSDLNGDVANFFEVLRNDTEELMRRLALTPFSSLEFERAKQMAESGIYPDRIERARCFYVRICQSRGATGKSFSRGCEAIRLSRAKTWRDRLGKKLPIIIEKLRLFEWDNCSYQSVFRRFDAPETLFYLDPPYLGETRVSKEVYEIENASVEFHKELLHRVVALKGMVAISGYDSALYNEALKGWHKVSWEVTTTAGTPAGSPRGKRTEVLWRNYELASDKQAALFLDR